MSPSWAAQSQKIYLRPTKFFWAVKNIMTLVHDLSKLEYIGAVSGIVLHSTDKANYKKCNGTRECDKDHRLLNHQMHSVYGFANFYTA